MMNRKKLVSRRSFVASSVAATAAATLTKRLAAQSSNSAIRIATIGVGNQGRRHVQELSQLANVQVAAICDVDRERLTQAQHIVSNATLATDLRRVLDDASIDAVTIATPDHWHAPAALLALAAGKHVYVEKPCTHNLRELQALVDAAATSTKVIAHGTQARSSPGMREAIQYLQEGIIGDVLLAKCWNWQRRKDIGHQQPATPPAHVDYDTWVGPAMWMPFQENRFHYDWHWWHNFGCGGIGNDGAHELDYALWGLGVESLPTKVSAMGGKLFFDDDQQFPDTQQVTFEFATKTPGKPKMLVYEQRLWSTNYPFNVDAGAEFYGSKGRMFLSKRGKLQVLGKRNAKIELNVTPPKSQLKDNLRNWVDCIRTGEVPLASMDAAARVTTCIHLGNIATRVGRTLSFDPQRAAILEDQAAADLAGREYRQEGHWAIPKLRQSTD